MTDEPTPPDEPAPEEAAPPPTRRIPSRLIAIAVAVAVIAGGSAVALALRSEDCPGEGAALKVGDRKVTVDQLERRTEVLKALYGLTPPPESDKAKSDAYPRDLAKSVAVGLMIDREVAERELQAAVKAVRDALDRYIADAFPEGGRARFVEALGNQGVSEADVLAEFRRLLETRRLFDAVTGDVSVTDAEVERAFAERQDRLAVPERRRLRHLVVATEADAQAAAARVRAGEAFTAVASAVSLDAATKAAGGELGFLTAAELAPPFAEAAFAATPGQPFGPVQTDRGWHIGVVEEITPGRAVTLDEVRDSLRQTLAGEQRLTRWRGYLGELIAESDACYGPRFRPADPKAPPADITGGAPTTPSSR